MFRDPLCAVTVCVGYGDFLRETIKWNRHHFDKWVVVTSPDDRATRGVCAAAGVLALVTEDHQRGGTFSKGRLVERGLQQLPADAWIVHLDADIVLPLAFRHLLDRSHLKDESIYGADRLMLRSWAEWQRLQASGWLHAADHYHLVSPPAGFPVGARWVGPDGYVPIGFFQLWHRIGGGEEWSGRRTKPYPSGHGTAAREDVQHGLQWDRRQRELLPELFVVHLESEPAKCGANWSGRTTKRFGPPQASGPASAVS